MATNVIYSCDRCGSEMKSKYLTVKPDGINSYNIGLYRQYDCAVLQDEDICRRCLIKILESMND